MEGATQGAVHWVCEPGDDVSSVKGSFAFTPRMEVAAQKRFSRGQGEALYDPVFSAKFRLSQELTLATVIDSTPGWRDSVLLLTGREKTPVVLGLGTNLGKSDREQNAHFGRLSNQGRGGESVFFLLGAQVKVTGATRLLMDYNGGIFSLGARYAIDERTGLELGYFTRDRRNPSNRLVLGAQFGF